MVKARFDAEVSELSGVIDFVNGLLTKKGWSNTELPVIDVAVEEIFVNIASYAYKELPNAEKYADISVDTDKKGNATIVFEDEGIEYNPLLRKDPDVTLPAQDRKIGGLGIYMVKNSMDSVSYARVDGKNVFTIMKKI
ncbi:MAG: ATP-binding protein [Lachnospiraceae bacterium]|nr:ATP-binding protein [Lachnospiraceae bacterium]